MHKIEAANNGGHDAFAHVLDLAYGRKGKLRWEIIEPILSDSNAQIPAPIIPSVKKSQPPVYSPELQTLLTSSDSRRTKPLSLKSLAFPPTLPSRANPASEDARLLGPFSKRREVNTRWRYFSKEWKKVRPPLQVVLTNTISEETQFATSSDEVVRAGIRGIGMQGRGVFEDIKAIVGPVITPKRLTRRERHGDGNATCPKTTRHPSRWLRRRFQELLGRTPVLAYSRHTDKDGLIYGKYSVSLPENALAPSLRFDSSRIPEVYTSADQQWLQLTSREDEEKPNSKAAHVDTRL
ncbi:hypothetical protein H0H81_012547 [Sphagnurus paluster]|uniref:LYR motif-containing protein Cup1-like N-terminal domain-containing protein n=1 Tax=Sphagnurus paluster TaxID=117069 RepID=A0A9P7K232_9AGAR|nr:hypothetical protein H0H81_012547 [Sphagnurus paluster]